MKKITAFLAVSLLFTALGYGQKEYPPEEVIVGQFIGETMPLREFAKLPKTTAQERSNPIIVVDQFVPIATDMERGNTPTVIPDLQTENGKIASLPLEQNFVGSSNAETGFVPADPTGAVGPNHYVHSVNSLVKIFDKQGNLEVGPVSLANFLGIPSNNGDPIVLYDQLVDRWVVSEFGSISGGNSLAFGVSTSSDPGGSYNVYQFSFSSLPDYPKYSVWHDAYYGTINLGGFTTRGLAVDKNAMLAGEPDADMLVFTLPDIVVNPNQVKSPVTANVLGNAIDTSAPGYLVYLQDDSWGTSQITFDHLKVWEIDADFDNGTSTISDPLIIPTDPFDSSELFGNGNGALRQPGTSQRLAAHGGIVSFSSNYREFADHNSWLITFNTFIDANETGGIRWIELRNDSMNDWSIFQEGTFSIADGHSRVMSSSAMDAQGNIGLAYTTGSTNLAPSLRYTGRFAGDPLGQMTVAETVIINGPGVRTNFNRYGDYSHMTMDPDNFTFWFTSDYFPQNNFWASRIASFRISGGFALDTGIISIDEPNNGVLGANETVEVTIRNFGSTPQTNLPLELIVDGSLVATENFTGTLNPGEAASYTFTQTLDLSTVGQTYEIEVATDLTGDEFAGNDGILKEVTSLFTNDIGALEITAPVNGIGLGQQTVSVDLRNFGADPQSGFDLQYTVNGGDPVVETFSGTLESEQTQSFNFSEQADLSDPGSYEITVTTLLDGDQVAANNSVTTTIENILCRPSADCSLGDGFQLVSIAEINNVSACEGYGDFTDQVANLAPGSTNDLTITTGRGDQYIKVWIDYNDNFRFTANELIIDNAIIAPGEGPGSYTEVLELIVDSGSEVVGEHIMRVKSNFGSEVPPEACDESQFGETEDYTVNIGVLGVNDFEISNSDLVVVTRENNLYDVTLTTAYDQGAYLRVFNILGQEVAFEKNLEKEGNSYKATLDMSGASSGVYIVKVGGHVTTSYKTARIIVE